MIFFTSDTHFGHTNILKYTGRHFGSAEEMDEHIARIWNSCVSNRDTVYHLGDVCLKYPCPVLGRLNGKKFLVPGGHDKVSKMANHFHILDKIHFFKLRDIEMVLCHYAMRSWPKSHYGAWHLYGHSHGKLPMLGRSMDIGVDTHDFYPYSLDEISCIMNNIPTHVVSNG